MNLFRMVDGFILEEVTKFAHSFQRWTGRTNFVLAKWGRFISFVGLVVQIADRFLKYSENPPPWILTFFLIPVALLMAREGRVCEDADRKVRAGDIVLPTEVLRIREQVGWRLFFLILSVVQSAFFFGLIEPGVKKYLVLQIIDWNGFPWGSVIFLYFASVNPLPPGKSKVREWVESFRAKLVPVKVRR